MAKLAPFISWNVEYVSSSAPSVLCHSKSLPLLKVSSSSDFVLFLLSYTKPKRVQYGLWCVSVRRIYDFLILITGLKSLITGWWGTHLELTGTRSRESGWN